MNSPQELSLVYQKHIEVYMLMKRKYTMKWKDFYLLKHKLEIATVKKRVGIIFDST